MNIKELINVLHGKHKNKEVQYIIVGVDGSIVALHLEAKNTNIEAIIAAFTPKVPN